MNQSDFNRITNWKRRYREETPIEIYTPVSEEKKRFHKVRRRIEDVQLGLELDDVFKEVWE